MRRIASEHKGAEMANIESDGRGYGVAMVMQSLLHDLEKKGVLSGAARTSMLDSVCEEISRMGKEGVMSPDVAADAARTVGLMYTRPVSGQ
jgi:hypothetical protein